MAGVFSQYLAVHNNENITNSPYVNNQCDQIGRFLTIFVNSKTSCQLFWGEVALYEKDFGQLLPFLATLATMTMGYFLSKLPGHTAKYHQKLPTT